MEDPLRHDSAPTKEDLGYGPTPTSSELGYGSSGESLNDDSSAPASEDLGYGSDEIGLGYGTQLADQNDTSNNSNTDSEPNRKRSGPRRRCSVTKYSLDAPDTVTTNEQRNLSSRSNLTLSTADGSSSSSDDNSEDASDLDQFDHAPANEEEKKKKGGKLFRRMRRAMSVI